MKNYECRIKKGGVPLRHNAGHLAAFVAERQFMAVEVLSLDGTWLLRDYAHGAGEPARAFGARVGAAGWIETPVPGDIHPTLAAAGRLPADLFAERNVEQCRWTGEREWWFRRTFDVPKRFGRQRTELVFDGIDLYGTVWVNGTRVGETQNSFRPYRFDVTKLIKPGRGNVVAVRIGPTLKILEQTVWQKYFACFNTPRIFARKAQCQFSWDWAPHLPALGIWRSVRIETFDSGRIMDVAVRPRNDGHVTFHIELDERTHRQDLDQKRVSSKGQEQIVRPHGEFVVEITGPQNVAKRGRARPVRFTAGVTGQKSFFTVQVPNPRLWWPNELGEQPLYRYRIRLMRGGRVHHEASGRFAFREVRVVEEPVGPSRMSFRFEVNGVPVFCKGANWVPPSCFPATVTEATYRHLVRLAQDGHYNMLRVWGGGIYEADAFYDACDELGVMVWQDLMFACSDYPDDDPAFVENVVSEIEHQVRRLRNRPCVVYWCGGNEKTGSAGFKVTYGERLFHVILRGLCNDLDPTRDYRPASPHSYTDLGNDPTSGETHGGCYEKAFEEGTLGWRDVMKRFNAVFHSEFGFHGPPRMESLVKFVPRENVWPLSETMQYHVQDNPYNSIAETFAEVQAKMAEKLVGDIDDAESFVRCASAFHAELLAAEIAHHRRRKWDNAGAMFWMFNDCWPCASWSVVDYYLLPKPAYYAAKRAFSPVLLTFVEEPDRYDLYLVNDTLKAVRGRLAFGQGRLVGRPAWSRSKPVQVAANGAAVVASVPKRDVRREANTYLYARLRRGAQMIARTEHFHRPWREMAWPEPGLRVRVLQSRGVRRTARDSLVLEIKTEQYARTVQIDGVEGAGVLVSDNFFDLMPGERAVVRIDGARPIQRDSVRVRHWPAART
jgi:beta-mannosidase